MSAEHAETLRRAVAKMREDADKCGDEPGSFIPATADLLEREASLIDAQVFPQCDPVFERYPLAVAVAYLGTEQPAANGITGKAPGPSRVYLPHARIAHFLPAGSLSALCDKVPAGGKWLGAGCSCEQEHAASLPLCSMCEYRSRSAA